MVGWRATPTIRTVNDSSSVGAAFSRDLGLRLAQNLMGFLIDRQTEDLLTLLKHQTLSHHIGDKALQLV